LKGGETMPTGFDVKDKKGYAKRWLAQMKDQPCYAPNRPLYEVCLNMDNNAVKRLDCDVCVGHHPGLKDPLVYVD